MSLRVVAWLAGNLARDQASELMDARQAAAGARAETPSPAPTEPPPQAPPAPGPPVSATAPAPPPAVATTVPVRGPDSDGAAPWRVELSVVRGTTPQIEGWFQTLPKGGLWRLELLSPSRPGRWSWAAGLDFTSDLYFLNGGLSRRIGLPGPRWLAADAGFGGGVAFERYLQQNPVSEDSYIETKETRLVPFVHVTGTARVRAPALRRDRRHHENRGKISSSKQPIFAFSAGVRIALQ